MVKVNVLIYRSEDKYLVSELMEKAFREDIKIGNTVYVAFKPLKVIYRYVAEELAKRNKPHLLLLGLECDSVDHKEVWKSVLYYLADREKEILDKFGATDFKEFYDMVEYIFSPDVEKEIDPMHKEANLLPLLAVFIPVLAVVVGGLLFHHIKSIG